MTRLHHPNIVNLKEVTASRDRIYMVMELVPGGELFDYIIENGPLQVASSSFSSIWSVWGRAGACALGSPEPLGDSLVIT